MFIQLVDEVSMFKFRKPFVVWIAIMAPLTGYLWIEANANTDQWVSVDIPDRAANN